MPPKLSDDDSRAVDVLLDTSVRASAGNFAAVSESRLQPHIKAAERLLALLSTMAEEPALTDLTARVMERISEVDQDIRFNDLGTQDNLGTMR